MMLLCMSNLLSNLDILPIDKTESILIQEVLELDFWRQILNYSPARFNRTTRSRISLSLGVL